LVIAYPDQGSLHNLASCPKVYHVAHSAPKSESLPRSRIIRRRSVFETARNKGRRVSSRHFILNFIARDALSAAETGSVAFLTPKRLGPATTRNKLRRRMREIYRRVLARPGEGSYLIWIARPPAVELSFDELKQAMSELAKRASGGSPRPPGAGRGG